MIKNLLRAGVLSSLLFVVTGCAHFFEGFETSSHFAAATSADASLVAFYEQRAQLIDTRFMAPVFKGNIVTWFSPDKAKFADNTVYLGNVIAWRALAAGGPNPGAQLKKISAIVRHIKNDLSVTSKLPNGMSNRGFFWRDDVRFESAALDGKTYRVASDAQGTGNEMSQDQIVHLLYGYSLAMNAVRLHPNLPEAAELRNLLIDHAHEIGVRLKAFNYMVVNPEGDTVARGADARGFAWPIARAISLITGRDLSTYLESVFAKGPGGEPILMDSTKLRELFYAALDGLSTGICDLKVGTDERDICARFTLRMINSVYFASRSFDTKPLYIERMDADGDYLGAASARIARGSKLPERYFAELKSAVGTGIASNTAPGLWCRESRWIFMPTTCPEEDDGTVYSYNGVDFLAFYAALRFGAPILKVKAPQ